MLTTMKTENVVGFSCRVFTGDITESGYRDDYLGKDWVGRETPFDSLLGDNESVLLHFGFGR